MRSLARQPSRRLTPFVRAMSFSPPSHSPAARDLILPDAAAVSLWFNLNQDEFATYDLDARTKRTTTSGAIAAGPSDQSSIIEIEASRSHVCVDLVPGTAAALLGGHLAELRNELVDLGCIWPGAASLRERLLDAGSPAAMLALIDSVLVDHLSADQIDDAAREAARLLHRGLPVAVVADEVGLTTRTLLRRFIRAYGVSPKRFARVQRLKRLTASIAPHTDLVDWAQLAATHGYADQSHLIDEFRDLVGVSPTVYIRHRGAGPSHMTVTVDGDR